MRISLSTWNGRFDENLQIKYNWKKDIKQHYYWGNIFADIKECQWRSSDFTLSEVQKHIYIYIYIYIYLATISNMAAVNTTTCSSRPRTSSMPPGLSNATDFFLHLENYKVSWSVSSKFLTHTCSVNIELESEAWTNRCRYYVECWLIELFKCESNTMQEYIK